MDTETEQKLTVAKQKKDTGDQAFKEGNIPNALRSYHEAVMYLEGITRNAASSMGLAPNAGSADSSGDPKPKTEADELLEKIYSNMAACQIKKGNWKRAVECADKALAKNPKNTKAGFRKGKALGEMGYFEKADKILSDLLTQDPPDGPAIKAELERLRKLDKELEKKHNQKLRGFLNREKATKSSTNESGKVEDPQGSKITEWVDDGAGGEVADD
ncbi:hypothetical protein NM688_g3079 [Phlebia brevispora]|uniref:Uncharacterized protein n=1 Tax=Phlebia brevispora TaxID=194682 RepID=A0ACC1T6Z7_9APHY|nr:hypothetical protein NM688_g3079 [Phlebia brevispora]